MLSTRRGAQIALGFWYIQERDSLSLDLLRDGNGRLAAELDHLGHGLVEGRLLGPAVDARVVVLLLLVPELGDCLQQLLWPEPKVRVNIYKQACQAYLVRIGRLHDLSQLVVVVLHDHRLHSHGAGHGRLLAHQGCAGAQHKPGHIPQRRHNRRTDAMLLDELLELPAVLLLLLPHVADGLAHGSVAQNGHLAGVNTIGAQFAGMINAYDLVGEGIRTWTQWRSGCGCSSCRRAEATHG